MVKYLGIGVLLLACAACSTGMVAMVSTVQDAFRGKGGSASPQLNPQFRYLRVAIQGRVVFLALGNEDKHALGPIEVWYSASKEVLRLQNGRVAGAAGLTTEWRSVVLDDAPSWSAAAGASRPQRWVRTRDVMPGYHFAVREQLEVREIQPPQKISLQGTDSQRLNWFEERVVPAAKGANPIAATEPVLPAARYAVDFQGDLATVVYGEQCLAPGLCFSWQRWKP
jgi:hypothetical protein